MTPLELQHEVEQFYYREARLLDEARFEEWLSLFLDDATYWAPHRDTRERGEPTVQEGAFALFEEQKAFLVTRIKRLDTGLAHAEQPPSRTRHFVTNVEVAEQTEDRLTVYSNILVFQSRLEDSEAFFVGKREDTLLRTPEGLKIAGRKILLDQRLLPRAVSVLF